MMSLAWHQFRLERRMFWRNPTAAFFNFLLPLLLLALFGAVFAGRREDLDVIVPGIAGVSVMSATFIALAYNLTFLREQGVLKRLRGTPLPVPAYMAGVAASAVTNVVLQLTIVICAGHLVFGVALSHAIPNSESAPAYVNAVFLPMLMIAGVFYDEQDAPAFLRDIAEVLPLKHLVDGLSGAIVHGEGVGDHLVALLVLGLWTAVGLLLAIRGFSWEAGRDRD